MEEKKILKLYRYRDPVENKTVYIYGTDKYDAVYRNYPKEQGRIILKTCKIERDYTETAR